MPDGLPRRTILKSAALLGASALAGGMSTMSFANRGGGPGNQNTGGLRKGMIGVMLPHEQFKVPDLVHRLLRQRSASEGAAGGEGSLIK